MLARTDEAAAICFSPMGSIKKRIKQFLYHKFSGKVLTKNLLSIKCGQN